MNITCEMIVSGFFKFHNGQIALVGNVMSDVNTFIFDIKADLYVDDQRIKTINIIGEDRFFGGNVDNRQGKRSVRTEDDILDELNSSNGKVIKLILHICKMNSFNDEEFFTRAERFLKKINIEFVSPGKIGLIDNQKVEVIFLVPLALEPGVVIDPPDVRVWVSLNTDEVTLIEQM